MRRLVDAIRAWFAHLFGGAPLERDAKREFDDFFGS